MDDFLQMDKSQPTGDLQGNHAHELKRHPCKIGDLEERKQVERKDFADDTHVASEVEVVKVLEYAIGIVVFVQVFQNFNLTNRLQGPFEVIFYDLNGNLFWRLTDVFVIFT
jgi:hypothetical protein